MNKPSLMCYFISDFTIQLQKLRRLLRLQIPPPHHQQLNKRPLNPPRCLPRLVPHPVPLDHLAMPPFLLRVVVPIFRRQCTLKYLALLPTPFLPFQCRPQTAQIRPRLQSQPQLKVRLPLKQCISTLGRR